MKKIIMSIFLIATINLNAGPMLEDFKYYIEDTYYSYYSENLLDKNIPKWETKINGYQKYKKDFRITFNEYSLKIINSIMSSDKETMFVRIISEGKTPSQTFLNNIVLEEGYETRMFFIHGYSIYMAVSKIKNS